MESFEYHLHSHNAQKILENRWNTIWYKSHYIIWLIPESCSSLIFYDEYLLVQKMFKACEVKIFIFDMKTNINTNSWYFFLLDHYMCKYASSEIKYFDLNIGMNSFKISEKLHIHHLSYFCFVNENETKIWKLIIIHRTISNLDILLMLQIFIDIKGK
jgi:hypothetical protein